MFGLCAAFDGAPEELDTTIVEQSSQQAGAIDTAAAAFTAKVNVTAAQSAKMKTYCVQRSLCPPARVVLHTYPV